MNPTIKARIESIRRGEVPEGYKRTKIGIVPYEWKVESLKSHLIEYRHLSNDIDKFDIYSSSRNGLMLQSAYYSQKTATQTNLGYKTVPHGYVTYRHMSDDDIFHFNINRQNKTILVSVEYPVFNTDEQTNTYFLIAYLNSMARFRYFCRGQKMGGTRTRLYFNVLGDFKLAFPSISEQEKIAEILAGQDRVIALKEQLLAEKQKQKKYFMQQLLTGKKRLPGFSGEWKEGELGDMVLECNDGSTPSRKNDDFFNGDINWVVVEDIRPYIYSTKEKLSKKGVESANLKVWKRGTVIISTCASIGLVGILCCEAATKQGITAILVNEDNSNEYVRFWLENEKSALLKFAQGSSIREIRSPILLKLKINYPCMQEQNAIVKILLMADKEIELLKKDIEQEKLKKKSLMQLLLTGIVRVDELTA